MGRCNLVLVNFLVYGVLIENSGTTQRDQQRSSKVESKRTNRLRLDIVTDRLTEVMFSKLLSV